MRLVAVGAGLAVLTAACIGPSDTGSGDTTVLQPSDVHLFGTSDEIALVDDLEVLPDGSVWVLNSVEPLFVGFDANGDVVSSHGRLGGGPDEFNEAAGFVEGGIDGGAWVIDTQRLVLREISGPERGAREIALPRDAFSAQSIFGTNPFRIWVRTARLGDEVVIPRRAEAPLTPAGVWQSIWTADLVAVDVRNSTARDALSLGAVLGDPTGRFELEGSGISFPLWYRIWTVCSGDELRVYDRFRNQVRRFTAGGEELPADTLPPVALTDVSARQYSTALFDLAAVAGMGEVPAGGVNMSDADSARVVQTFLPRVTAGGSELANLLPRYVDLRCDRDGTQWIHPFDIDAPGSTFGGLRGGRVWLRTRPDGETARVRMPDRFDPYRFTPDRIWGVQRNDLDVATVAWIEVP